MGSRGQGYSEKRRGLNSVQNGGRALNTVGLDFVQPVFPDL